MKLLIEFLQVRLQMPYMRIGLYAARSTPTPTPTVTPTPPSQHQVQHLMAYSNPNSDAYANGDAYTNANAYIWAVAINVGVSTGLYYGCCVQTVAVLNIITQILCFSNEIIHWSRCTSLASGTVYVSEDGSTYYEFFNGVKTAGPTSCQDVRKTIEFIKNVNNHLNGNDILADGLNITKL